MNGRWVIEVYALDPVNTGEGAAMIVNGGMRWQLSETLTLDGAVGTAISGDGPDLSATMGLAWTF